MEEGAIVTTTGKFERLAFPAKLLASTFWEYFFGATFSSSVDYRPVSKLTLPAAVVADVAAEAQVLQYAAEYPVAVQSAAM